MVPRNIRLDAKTVRAMVNIYCHDRHGSASGQLCPDCDALASYADLRLIKCPFGPDKTTCRACPVHCYRPDPRAKMHAVMRYAGPKMLLRHPVLAVRHLYLDRKGAPPWPPSRRSRRGVETAESVLS